MPFQQSKKTMFRKKDGEASTEKYAKLEDEPSTKPIENVPLNKTFDTEASSHDTGHSASENWSRYTATKQEAAKSEDGGESDLSSINSMFSMAHSTKKIASFDLDEAVDNDANDGNEFEVLYAKSTDSDSSKGEGDFKVIYTKKSEDSSAASKDDKDDAEVKPAATNNTVMNDDSNRISQRAFSLFETSNKTLNKSSPQNNATPTVSGVTSSPEEQPTNDSSEAANNDNRRDSLTNLSAISSSDPDIYTEEETITSQESGQDTVENSEENDDMANDVKANDMKATTAEIPAEQEILSEEALDKNAMETKTDTDNKNITETASTVKAKNTGPRDPASILSMHCKNIKDIKSYLERWKDDRPFDEETLGYAASLYQASERGFSSQRGIDERATEDLVPPMPKDFYQAVSLATAAGAADHVIPPPDNNALREMVKGSYDDAKSKRQRRRYGIIIFCCVVLIVASIVAIVVSSNKGGDSKNDDPNNGGTVSSSSAINSFNLTLGFPSALNSTETDEVGNDLESVLPGYLTQASTTAGESEITGYVLNVVPLPNNAERRGLQLQDPEYTFSVEGMVNLETRTGEVVDTDELVESIDSTVNEACSDEEAFSEYVSTNSNSDHLKSSTGLSVKTETHFSPSPSNMPSLKPTKTSDVPTSPPSRVFPTPSPSSSSPTITTDTSTPTKEPTRPPSRTPTKDPTGSPSRSPTEEPTTTYPTVSPSGTPSYSPSNAPTPMISKSPTVIPVYDVSKTPTVFPSISPTQNPTIARSSPPSSNPSAEPAEIPTGVPTKEPTASPSIFPIQEPTESPISFPSKGPAENRTSYPTKEPTESPTREPTEGPTSSPTCESTIAPYRDCYPYLQGVIRVGFANCNPQEGDWVGLYNFDTGTLLNNRYDAWKYTCGNRSCNGSPSSGILEFRARNLDLGQRYRAILIRAEDGPPPFTALAYSPRVFNVRAQC